MSQTPHSKTVTFSNAQLRAEVSSTSRTVEVYPQDEAILVLSRLGYADGSYDLISPKTGLPYSPTSLPFNDLTDGGTVTVQVSKRNSPR